ncbi:hypothetical protein [Bifidobacterium sp. ESL0704]|uniref:hypothetical protein n=1 Tax=Bifidobacterium sp. ESL0704 TaxID=2983219 RepID=UPI0023F9340D|nr:hypothetical protein [Bifidobacterium sp. ESL0704]WEV52368.1 hypothetical protein OZX64_05535 [Bifidobacterium sp. ESL0704]
MREFLRDTFKLLHQVFDLVTSQFRELRTNFGRIKWVFSHRKTSWSRWGEISKKRRDHDMGVGYVGLACLVLCLGIINCVSILLVIPTLIWAGRYLLNAGLYFYYTSSNIPLVTIIGLLEVVVQVIVVVALLAAGVCCLLQIVYVCVYAPRLLVRSLRKIKYIGTIVSFLFSILNFVFLWEYDYIYHFYILILSLFGYADTKLVFPVGCVHFVSRIAALIFAFAAFMDFVIRLNALLLHAKDNDSGKFSDAEIFPQGVFEDQINILKRKNNKSRPLKNHKRKNKRNRNQQKKGRKRRKRKRNKRS